MTVAKTSIRAGLHSLHGRLLAAKDKFVAFWLAAPRGLVSIALGEDGSAAIVELTPVGDRYLLTARELWLKSSAPDDIAEEIALDLARAGWEQAPRVLIVPERYAQGFVFRLPPGAYESGAHNEAYWEMVAEIGGEPDKARQLTPGMPLASGGYYISVIERSCIGTYTAAFNAAECELTNIVLGAPNAAELDRLAGEMLVEWQAEEMARRSAIVSEALYGGLSYLAPVPTPPATCTLLERTAADAERYSYPRIAGALLALTFLVLLLLTGGELYNLHNINVENEQVRSELALKSPELKKMKLLEQVTRDTAQKEQILTQLTAENIPWYAMLVHLGTLTVDGVRLERLDLTNKNYLRLDGYAATYEALAEFLARFEQDKDFFPHGPLLQNTTTEDAGLRFSVSLEL